MAKPSYAPPRIRVWKKKATEADPYSQSLQAWQKKDKEKKKQKLVL